MTPQEYNIHNIDVVIIEGVFLFRRDINLEFDYKVWIDISEKTALNRAIERNQEGLSTEELKQDFKEIYFAAQHIHIKNDQPKSQADFIINNETEL